MFNLLIVVVVVLLLMTAMLRMRTSMIAFPSFKVGHKLIPEKTTGVNGKQRFTCSLGGLLVNRKTYLLYFDLNEICCKAVPNQSRRCTRKQRRNILKSPGSFE